MLRECVEELDKVKPGDPALRQRVLEMLTFVEALTSLYEEIHRMPTGSLRALLKARGRIRQAFGRGSPG